MKMKLEYQFKLCEYGSFLIARFSFTMGKGGKLKLENFSIDKICSNGDKQDEYDDPQAHSCRENQSWFSDTSGFSWLID